VQRHLAGKLLIQSPEEPDKLLVAMPLMALSDDTPLQYVECREQRSLNLFSVGDIIDK
jgi:hypothetical protein